jgi:hypothetical protein
MPEFAFLQALLAFLRAGISELRTNEDGYSTETAIVVALIAAAAIALATAIVAAIAKRTNDINGF